MIIAIDFDGTVVKHDYPNVGEAVPGAISALHELVANGHSLILFTMRSGARLEDAINWFEKNGIRLWGIQYNPNQTKWTSSNKCYAEIYIDDAALGIPLMRDVCMGDQVGRPYVDWVSARRLLAERFLLEKKIEDGEEDAAK